MRRANRQAGRNRHTTDLNLGLTTEGTSNNTNNNKTIWYKMIIGYAQLTNRMKPTTLTRYQDVYLTVSLTNLANQRYPTLLEDM